MRTTETEIQTCYSQKEVEQSMIEEGLVPTPFPTLPVEIQFQGGKVMCIREREVIGMDDEAAIDERQFVIRIVRPIAE